MEPKSLSASAMHVAQLCKVRYHAENIQYSKGIANDAASLGSAVHGALEPYVKTAIMTDEREPTLKYLLDLFKISYMTVFHTVETNTEDFADGVEMLTKWHARTDFTGVTVLSAEVKKNFPIPTSIGEIPFNYIMDRFDQIGEHEYKVVDYKTNRWGIRPEDLKKKVQARAYSVAAQIAQPDAERIWVEFDMLRHDSPVGIVFTRDENIAAWKFMKELAQEIVDTKVEDLKPTLNPECLFCVLKATCPALVQNITTGGIFSFKNNEEAVDRRAMLEYQAKAINAAVAEIDKLLLTEAKELEVFGFESQFNQLEITMSKTRTVDAEMVEMAIGPRNFAKYGGKKITIKAIEDMLKSSDLTPEQKVQVRGLIYYKNGEPKVKVSPKNAIDGD